MEGGVSPLEERAASERADQRLVVAYQPDPVDQFVRHAHCARALAQWRAAVVGVGPIAPAEASAGGAGTDNLEKKWEEPVHPVVQVLLAQVGRHQLETAKGANGGGRGGRVAAHRGFERREELDEEGAPLVGPVGAGDRRDCAPARPRLGRCAVAWRAACGLAAACALATEIAVRIRGLASARPRGSAARTAAFSSGVTSGGSNPSASSHQCFRMKFFSTTAESCRTSSATCGASESWTRQLTKPGCSLS